MSVQGVQFGRVPSALMRSGIIGDMTGADAKVYLAICAHASRDWEAYPSVATLACVTKLHEGTVKKAIGRLEGLGLITVFRGGGRHRTNTYRLTNSLPENTVSPETVSPDAPKRCSKKPQTVSHEDKNGIPPDTTTDNTTEQQQQQKQSPAAAGVRKELILAGIGPPTCDELARAPAISVDMVKAEAAKVRKRGKPTGVLVQNLRAAIEATDLAARSEAEIAEYGRREAEARHRAAQQKAQDEQTAKAWIVKQSDASVTRMFQTANAHRPRAIPLLLQRGGMPPSLIREQFAVILFQIFGKNRHVKIDDDRLRHF